MQQILDSCLTVLCAISGQVLRRQQIYGILNDTKLA